MTSTILTSRWKLIPAIGMFVLIGTLYFLTFHGSKYLLQSRDGLAFADTADYVELLKDQHYSRWLREKPTDNTEYRRKTVHHLDYLLLGNAFVHGGHVLTKQADLTLIWLVSPVLGAINFLLAFQVFRRTSAINIALPAAITYALIPATWIYSSLPETWILSGTAVMLVLLLRDRGLPSWLLATLIALFALNNFLLLLLSALTARNDLGFWKRCASMIKTGAMAVTVWLLLLSLLGLLFSPDFLPARYFELTVRFKESMPENLPVLHPGRWVYEALNGWIAPFVLNQQELNFGRYALLDTARRMPLGAVALLVFAFVVALVLLRKWQSSAVKIRKGAGWAVLLSTNAIYLFAVFLMTGIAAYYEAFLYSQLVVPVLLMVMVRAVSQQRFGTVVMWTAAFALGLNSAQQMFSFRAALGL